MPGNNNKVKNISKDGLLTWKDLQLLNALQLQGQPTYDSRTVLPKDLDLPRDDVYPRRAIDYAISGPVETPLRSSTNHLGVPDYWGSSIFDAGSANDDQLEILSDLRAENQPGILKITNGIAKGFVTAATTALEGVAGLTWGVADAAITGKLSHLWDNPITRALQELNDLSEEYMPNYYTKDEQENPFSHIFSANFLGDKLIKNFGFMVGAFYGGLPISKGIGAIGRAAVRTERLAQRAREMGMAAKEANALEEAALAGKGTEEVLKAAGLTSMEKGKALQESIDRITRIAKTTRNTASTVGALSSAINEGAIEAINNSRDWERMATAQENDRYQKLVQILSAQYGDTPEGQEALAKAQADHESFLAEIQEKKAQMGNADLFLNIPILLASNLAQLGKLYARGFNSTRRILGNSWTGKMAGVLGELHTTKTLKKGIMKGILNANYEGLEEYMQRAASDGAGEAVNAAIERFRNSGKDEDAKNSITDFILDFGKSFSKNLRDPNAWEEYLIGALSAALGMPVTGSQASNAYMSIGKVGFAGGVVGTALDYRDAMNTEKKVADYLNQRVKDPKFAKAWDIAIKHNHIDKLIRGALTDEDKLLYKDLDTDNLFHDINLAASTGHLDEFKELIKYNGDINDDELNDIMKNSTETVTAGQQKAQDVSMLVVLDDVINKLKKEKEDKEKEGGRLTIGQQAALDAYEEEARELKEKIDADEYKEIKRGPFVVREGDSYRMIEKEKAKEVLDRNRQHVLDSIDAYVHLRDIIDVETDGRLNDEQIEELTYMRFKLHDIENRSASIVRNIIEKLGKVADDEDTYEDAIANIANSFADYEEQRLKPDLDKAKAAYEAAKTARENAERTGKEESEISKLKKKEEEAKKKVEKQEKIIKGNQSNLSFFKTLSERKKTTFLERRAFRKGASLTKEQQQELSDLDVAPDYVDGGKLGKSRALNVDEIQAYFASTQNAMALQALIGSWYSPFSLKEKTELLRDVMDLHTLAHMKVEYDKKIKEFIKDPNRVNEAIKESAEVQKKLRDEDTINKFASQIKEADTYPKLREIMKNIGEVDPAVASLALKKAIETADSVTKEFLENYQKALEVADDFIRKTLPYIDIQTHLADTLNNCFDIAIRDESDVPLPQVLIDTLRKEAKRLKESKAPSSIDPQIGKAIEEILDSISYTAMATGTRSATTSATVGSSGTSGSGSSGSSGGTTGGSTPTITVGGRTVNFDGLKVGITSAIKELLNNGSNFTPTFESFMSAIEKTNKRLHENITLWNAEWDKDSSIGGAKIDSNYIANKVQEFQNAQNEELEKAANNTNTSNEKSADKIGEEVSKVGQKMSEQANSSFISGPSQYDFYSEPRDKKPAYYKKEYTPRDDSPYKLAQEVLKACGAYDFVDSNILGHIVQVLGSKNVPIHMLRKADDDQVVYLAIDIEQIKQGIDSSIAIDDERKTLLKSMLDALTKTSVEYGGVNYQLVGALAHTNKAESSIQEAFKKVVNLVIEKTNDAANGIKEGSSSISMTQGFIAYDALDGYNGQVLYLNSNDSGSNGVNTGRLHRYANDSETLAASKDLSAFLEESREWQGGDKNITLATRVGDETKLERVIGTTYIEVSNAVDGAVYIYVPRPDGKYYPIMCRRKSVEELGDAGIDSILDLISPSSGGIKSDNTYFAQLLKTLKVLVDTSNPNINERIHAKSDLAKFLILKSAPGSSSTSYPISIDVFDEGKVKLSYGGRTLTLSKMEKSEDLGTIVKEFFDFLKTMKSDALFTVPSIGSALFSGGRIKQEDVISSNILSVSLNGFHNFNSNINITPMSMSDDGKLTPITVAGSTGGYTYKYNYVHRYSISNTTYGVTSEGRVIKVKDDGKGNIEEVEITDKDTKNIVLALHAVEEATKRGEHLGIENYFKSLGEISTDDDAAKVADYVYGGEVEIDGKTYKATSALLNLSPVIVQIDGNYFVVSKFAGKNIVRKLEDIQDLIDEVRENVIKPLKAYNLKRKSGPIDPGKPRGKGGTDPIIPPLEPGKGTNPFEDLTMDNVLSKLNSSTDSTVKAVLSKVSKIDSRKRKLVVEFLKNHGVPADMDAFSNYVVKINKSMTIKQVNDIITQMENDKSCYGLL